jgi:ATP-dependent exoDNAse (exonuclease V) beta subunit
MEKIAREKYGRGSSGGTPIRLGIDDILKTRKLEQPFGTLCHYMIEQRLSGRNDDIPILIESAFEEIDDFHRARLIETARQLSDGFVTSELGRKALRADRRDTEFSFLLALPNGGKRPWLVNGTMDLIFETDGCCIIVDFKTDSEMEPELHAIQLAAYRAAAVSFSDLPVETWLFYLRNAFPIRVEDTIPPDRLSELASDATIMAPAPEGW